jgi:hypothetical protein
VIELSAKVRKVTVLTRDAAGQTTPVVVFEQEGRKKRKKQSREVKPIERAVRRVAKAEQRTVNEYLSRHERSNDKRRDGWLRDLGVNVARAGRKGARRLRLPRTIVG